MDHRVLLQRLQIRRLFFIACVFVLTFANAYVVADAPGTPAGPLTQLQSKPNRCVALHQGQVCYQNVQLLWRAAQASDYCIYQQQAEAPLHCWKSAIEGEYFYAFASETPVQLQLVNVRTKASVAETTIEVAWVYKSSSRRKTHWRIF